MPKVFGLLAESVGLLPEGFTLRGVSCRVLEGDSERFALLLERPELLPEVQEVGFQYVAFSLLETLRLGRLGERTEGSHHERSCDQARSGKTAKVQ